MNMTQYEFKPPVTNIDTIVFYSRFLAERAERDFIKQQYEINQNVVMTNIVRTNDNGYIIKYYNYASGWHTLTKAEYNALDRV